MLVFSDFSGLYPYICAHRSQTRKKWRQRGVLADIAHRRKKKKKTGKVPGGTYRKQSYKFLMIIFGHGIICRIAPLVDL
jgi:hypothetical protein